MELHRLVPHGPAPVFDEPKRAADYARDILPDQERRHADWLRKRATWRDAEPRP